MNERRKDRPRPHDGAQRRSQRPRPKPNATPDDVAFGVNACAMALEAGAVKRLLFDEETGNARVLALVQQARDGGLVTESVPTWRLDELTGGGVHQGVLARLGALAETPLPSKSTAPGHSLVVLLDSITDPQNVGAILRTAVAVGVDAVVLPRRRGVQLTPGVHRASAGMSFFAPVAAPQNLAQAVAELKEAGYWVVAADQSAKTQDATAFDWPARTALILGSEGEGIGALLARESDFHVALPMSGRVESLNVGVAFGALAYLWRRQWPVAPE